jgi:hypothetical protein
MSIELSSEDEARQLKILTELRNRQHRLLVESGIARRMLDAKVPVNYMQNGDDFTEGTLLYPTRTELSQTAIGRLWGVRETISGSCRQAPQNLEAWRDFFYEHPHSDVVMLGRLEALEKGYSQSTIYTGIQLERGNPDVGIIPMNGIQSSDATDLGQLLKEVEEKHASGELSCLEPGSLVNLTIGRFGPTPLP